MSAAEDVVVAGDDDASDLEAPLVMSADRWHMAKLDDDNLAAVVAGSYNKPHFPL